MTVIIGTPISDPMPAGLTSTLEQPADVQALHDRVAKQHTAMEPDAIYQPTRGGWVVLVKGRDY